jgi:thioredoxin reductase
MQAIGQHVPVLIIGAGPAGLALGAELENRGIDCLIVEKGNIANSWERMPQRLKLVSPWKCNWLSRSDRKRFKANAQLTRAEFLDYLRDYATAHALPVQTSCEVLSVAREQKGFTVSTSRGAFNAGIIVCATGYFSKPVRPPINGAATTAIPQLHYAEYRGIEQVRRSVPCAGMLLVVGKRLSAGQTMLELVDAGFRVALSYRSPIRFGVNERLWPVVYRIFPYVEAVKLKLGRGTVGKLDVRMPGGRTEKLIRSGTVKVFPPISRFERDTVVFEDNRRLQPALVFYATGFAPAVDFLGHLERPVCDEMGAPRVRDMESLTVPNLFFLGFEMLQNFQSRFLRGIRQDAIALAGQIEARIAKMEPKVQPVPEPAEA